MLQRYSGHIPTLLVANKVDLRLESTTKKFKFSESNNIPLYFTSSATGINVVRVFEDIINQSIQYKNSGQKSFVKEVLNIIEDEESF